MPKRTLIIGYGNPYRRDDGVALHVMNELRLRMGLPKLTLTEDGEDQLGRMVDTLMLHQLLPELAPIFCNYERVIFVDAHAGVIPEDVRVIPVEEAYDFQATTHHMSPGTMLALARQVNAHVPEGFLVSVRGEDFDFGEELTAACRRHALVAVEKILAMTA